MWISAAITAVLAYLLGNLNGAIAISRLVAHDDVRNHGSGNAGLTNFVRSYGGIASFAVIAIDVLKAVSACLIGGALLGRYGLRQEGMTLGGLCAVLGHCFPALLGFKGGKGILSGFAVILTVDWRIGLVVGGGFLLVYLLTFYVSLASIVGASIYVGGFLLCYRSQPATMIMGAAIGCLALFMHRQNMVRLIHGQERKTNFFKKKEKK